jgi:hypothetical protein
MSLQWLKKLKHRPRPTDIQGDRDSPEGGRYSEGRQRYYKRRRKELQNPHVPPFLPLERPRRLEAPLGPAEATLLTNEQQQSSFMQMPAELRVTIYRALCAYRTIHLWYGFWPGNWRGGRTRLDSSRSIYHKRAKTDLPNQWNFYHSICPREERFAPAAMHWHWKWAPNHGHSKCDYITAANSVEPYETETLHVMPLLFTCRRMSVLYRKLCTQLTSNSYTEVIDVLYSKNTFSVQMSDGPTRFRNATPQSLLTPPIFCRLLLPDHFQRITSLDLEWTLFTSQTYRDGLNVDPVLYKAWWQFVSSMGKLRKLCLHLITSPPPSPITEYCCSVINDPIEDMRHQNLDEFHIAAPEPFFRILRKIINPPCTFSFLNYQLRFIRPYEERFIRAPSYELPYDYGEWKRGEHEGIYFPTYDW